MATYTSTFIPATSNPTKIAALGFGTSSAEIIFANNSIISIEATGNVQVKFGNTGMTAADNTAWFIPQGAVHQFDLGHEWTSVRIFNPGASGTVDVYILMLSRA